MCYIDGYVIDYAKWCHIKHRRREGWLTNGQWLVTIICLVWVWPVRAVTVPGVYWPFLMWPGTNGQKWSRDCFMTCNCRWPMFVTDTRPTPTNKYLLRQNTNSKIGKIPHTQVLNYHGISPSLSLYPLGWESGHWQILIFYRETHLETLLNIQSLTRCNLNITTSNKISLVDGAERSWGQGRLG